ncbi:DUF445 domain-containing protein [Sphingomonas immobilis]|uniref:DUF445 domain-containing protein n=1 Tax=Sphingomonas immobilis TaxID=3063997 RepID=A0ABT9A163_9SPHN|nr:DUF445 domain-containing protein [Sphingomonas sp. CA1-15]MDO7843109.1 DUF445 domain-containing protein [Sphingomonas sp. CA1-15]
MKPFRLRSDAAAPPPALVRMRWIAGGLLVVMAATFLAARAFEPRVPALGFVRAFAEAAMVGGLADWFAVTALFRHPLGLPIPHTAIIPRNKDRIGTTLAAFLRDNFLIPRVVARRMQGLDVAGAVGRWLSEPGARDGRLVRGAGKLAVHMLEAFDQQRLGGMVKGAIGNRLRELDVSPLLGQALTAAIAEQRHLPLLDGIIRWAARVLEANEHLIRAMVHERAGSIMRWTGLDETLANKIIEGLHKMLSEMGEDSDHPLRAKAEEGLETLAHDLIHDPAMQARVEGIKAEIIANPAMQRWLDGLWEQARGGMLKMARNPDGVMGGPVGDMLRQLGETLQKDAALRATINRFVRRTAVGMAADYGDGIVRLVSETVRSWDAETITRRLENAVGRDLQYIRINGTLVGGLVGLAIHAVDVVLR